MGTAGIITIHKINNYGSVLQAYALQRVCEEWGYRVEMIDYDFPNEAHTNNPYDVVGLDSAPNEPRWIKLLFVKALIRQHRGISRFVQKYQHLSARRYKSPDELNQNPPIYDIYITGSDQLWSPRHCNGDTAFMLSFAHDDATRISYAASFGSNEIPAEIKPVFKKYLSYYNAISVRENSGRDLVKELIGKEASVVLDPTLLLNAEQWNEIAVQQRLVRRKYILCYFLNYSFNAFPYADELAENIRRQTGFEIVRVARPPHRLQLRDTKYKIGASPQEFLALVRDAEIVLTTSFHGTAFAVNYGRPVFSIVKDRNAGDSRQVSLMSNLGLDRQIIELGADFPDWSKTEYNIYDEQHNLDLLRGKSLEYLRKSLEL